MKNITPHMSDSRFQALSQQEAKRLGAIPERKDLLETRIIRLLPEADVEAKDKTILTVMRDPGNTAGILRVVERLLADGYAVDILADGRGLEAIKKKFGDKASTVSEESSPLAASAALAPDVMLLTHTTSEEGLENFSAASFENTPIVFIEDMYGAAAEFIERMKERAGLDGVLKRIEKICVSDRYAFDSIAAKYPDFKDKLVITGQPLYDRLHGEPHEDMRKKVRNGLSLAEDEKLIAFFGASSTDKLPQTPNTKTALELIVKQLRQWTGQKIKFIFRNHPRDLITPAQYQEIINELGEAAVPLRESNKFNVDEVNAAADVVVSLPFSTITYDSLYRDTPTLVLAEDAKEHERTRPVPSVETGAAKRVSDLSIFSEALSGTLDHNSESSRQMRKAREEYFKLDGRNTQRVANEVEKIA